MQTMGIALLHASVPISDPRTESEKYLTFATSLLDLDAGTQDGTLVNSDSATEVFLAVGAAYQRWAGPLWRRYKLGGDDMVPSRASVFRNA